MACGIRLIHIDLVWSFISFIFGFAGFGVFLLQNYESSLLALSSGILAGVAFHIHRLQFTNRLRDWYTIDMFGSIQFLAFIGILIGFSFTFWELFVQLYYKPPLIPILKSVLATLVWALLTMKWGLLLFITIKRYSKLTDGYFNLSQNNLAT